MHGPVRYGAAQLDKTGQDNGSQDERKVDNRV